MNRPRKPAITGGHSIAKWGSSIRKSLDETVVEQDAKIEVYEETLRKIVTELNRYCSEGWTTVE